MREWKELEDKVNQKTNEKDGQNIERNEENETIGPERRNERTEKIEIEYEKRSSRDMKEWKYRHRRELDRQSKFENLEKLKISTKSMVPRWLNFFVSDYFGASIM